MKAIRFGLVGAGPWAHLVHGPMLSAGPETELAAVWARRPEAAHELSGKFGGTVCADIDELIASVDAVAFSVPPGAQAELALKAIQAGKGVILEKPIADTLANARRLVDAIDKVQVPSLVTFSYRYSSGVREFIQKARTQKFRGGRAVFLTNAYLGGPFTKEWRLAGGSIIDIGPHAIDLMEQIVGPVESIQATHGAGQWTAVTLEHADGAVSQVSLCSHTATDPLRFEIDVYNESTMESLDVIKAMGPLFGDSLLSGKVPIGSTEAFTTMRAEFADAMFNGKPHPLSAHHGLHVQMLIEQAVYSIERGRAEA
jgi:predicted dehydrogenase